MCLSPSAAACSSAASTRRAWASQNSRSPDPALARGGDHVRGPLGRDHGIGAAGQRVERDRRRQPGQADGVEHEHRPAPLPQRPAQLVEVGAGARDEDGARGVEDPAGEPLRLAGARAAEHDRHVLDRRPHRQQPGPAQPHADLDDRAAATAPTGTARPATAGRRPRGASPRRRTRRGRCRRWRPRRPCAGCGSPTGSPWPTCATTGSTRRPRAARRRRPAPARAARGPG